MRKVSQVDRKTKLNRENETSNWQTRRISELEEEVAKMKNRTLRQQIWADIKPKRKSNRYGRYKWKEFGKKVLDVVLAVG